MTGAMIPVLVTSMGLYWRTFCAMATILPVVGIVHIYHIPESPHWLVMRRRMRAAMKALIVLRGMDYDCVRERDMLGWIGKFRLYSQTLRCREELLQL